MGNNRLIRWPILLGVTMMLLVLVVELLTNVLGNVAYVAICFFTLWHTQGRKQIISITVFATVLLLIGYILTITISEPVDQITFFVNRVSAVVAIWFACYFTIRYQNALADESRQRLEVEERKITEARLRSSQELHEAIARNFPGGWIGILDENLNYLFAEGMALNMAGIKSTDLIGEKFSKILGVGNEHFLNNACEGNHVAFDIQFRQRNFEVNVGPLLSNLNIRRLLVVAHDVTTMKETEIRLVETLEKERELNELKSRFVTMASHEFRTPLTTIQSSSTLLGMYTGNAYDKEKATHVSRIKGSVKLLTEMLNDFLSLEKLDHNNPLPRYETINLPDFLKLVVPELESLKRDNQQLVVKCFEIGNIITDKHFFRNIIYNLLSNAFKYSAADGRIMLEVKELDDKVNIRVIDNGIGIPLMEQEYIFDRFFRANNVVNIQGTGLGLTIVKKYTDLLEGTISFTSHTGDSTIFTLSLPLMPNGKEPIKH